MLLPSANQLYVRSTQLPTIIKTEPNILEKKIVSPKKNISTMNENSTSVYCNGDIIVAFSSARDLENII